MAERYNAFENGGNLEALRIAQSDGNAKTQVVDASGNVQPAGDSVTRPIYSATQPADTHVIDAFSRLRVSNPTTVFGSKQIFDNQPLFWDDQEVTGADTNSTYNINKAATTISVDDTVAGKRVRQTFQRFNYQPGKSQLVFMTFKVGTTSAGITKRIGLFDDENGLYLEKVSSGFKVVIRSKASGSVVNTEIDQANWNLDTLDGTGPSGINIQTTRTQTLIIDFQWLGVGRVRMGFVVDGMPVYCHEFLNANNLSTVYMSTPNLPLRFSIENSGSGSASTMDCICASVLSEGATQETGMLRYKSTEGTFINANVVGTIYAVVGIRLKAAAIGSTVNIEKISLLNTANDNFEWMLVLNPTLANAISFSNETNSTVQTGVGNSGDPSNSTVTGGTKIAGGFVNASGSAGSIEAQINTSLKLGADIAGNVDELYLCVRPLSANADIDGSVTWRELS